MDIFLLSSRMNSDVLLLLWWQQSSQLLGNSTHGGEVTLAISGNVELCDFIYSNYKNFNEKQQPEGKLLWQLSLWVSCFLVSLLNAPHGSNLCTPDPIGFWTEPCLMRYTTVTTLCWILFPQGVCQLQQSDEDEEESLHRRIDIRCHTLTLSQLVVVTALNTY